MSVARTRLRPMNPFLVAQAGSLLCRRLVVGGATTHWQRLRIANPRHSRLPVCATGTSVRLGGASVPASHFDARQRLAITPAPPVRFENSRRENVLRRILSLLLVFTFFASTCFFAVAATNLPPGKVSPPGVQQVIVVFKTHFDIGYTDMASNVVTKYRTTMMDQALKVVDQNRELPAAQQFVWTIPGWPMHKITEDWPGQTPERRARVLDAFKQGRFVVHALPFTTHTELLEPEDLVRGMNFSSRLARDAGLPLPRDAKMTDVPSHSWILPTLLKHAGVDFLHLGCNAASSSPRVPNLFWWEGPDGSRLLTMYTAEFYGTGLVPPETWPHKTWLALIHTGDNHGPPTPEEVRTLLDQAQNKLPGVNVRIGRLSDFADAILAEHPDLPVVRGDMPDTWIHGPLADPAGAKLARNLRPTIAATECLGTELRTWGVPRSENFGTLAAAYENSLLYGEHTWGGAFWWIYGKYILKFGDEWKAERAAGKFQRIESSWTEHTAYVEKARDLILPAQRGELTALARSVRVSRERIVVFNPLPWKRGGRVTLKSSAQFAAVKPAEGGPALSVAADGDTLSFIAPDLPPMGYQTFVPVKAEFNSGDLQADESAATIENGFFKLTLDGTSGTVRSLIAKDSGRELVDSSAPQGFGQYLYERFDRDQVQSFVKAYVKISADWGLNELGKPSLPPAIEVPYRATSPKNFKLRFERTPVSISAVMDAPAGDGLPNAVTTRLTLYQGQPWVDLEVTLHDKPPDAWPEAGWICLPLKVDAPQFRLGRLGSIVDPAQDIVAGCNFDQFALNSGMTVTDARGRGVGLCPLDSPLVSLGEPGGWKYSKEWTPRKPRVFVNLFNNQWSTNFRLWNSGTWTARVRLWATAAGTDPAATLLVPSWEARNPLLAAMGDGPAGKLPTTQAGVSVSRPGVLVTAFGENPDGAGTLLRVWDQTGKTGKLVVKLPGNFKTATPVNLRGEKAGAPISISAGALRFNLHAYAPASFLIQ